MTNLEYCVLFVLGCCENAVLFKASLDKYLSLLIMDFFSQNEFLKIAHLFLDCKTARGSLVSSFSKNFCFNSPCCFLKVIFLKF